MYKRPKTASGGMWGASGSVLGFDINTNAETIAAHRPKPDGNRPFVMCQEFAFCSQQIRLNLLHVLRGYMKRWLVASVLRAGCVQPIDFLAGCANVGDTSIICANRQIWAGFWDMVSLSHELPNGELDWTALFANKLRRAIALRYRFPVPRHMEEARR